MPTRSGVPFHAGAATDGFKRDKELLAIKNQYDNESAERNNQQQRKLVEMKHENNKVLAGMTPPTAEQHDANLKDRRDSAMMCVFWGVLIALVLVALYSAMNETKQQIEKNPVWMAFVYSVMGYLQLSDSTQTFVVHVTVNTWVKFFYGPDIVFKCAGALFVAQFFICCVGPCFETRKQPHRGLFSYPPAWLMPIMAVSFLIIRFCAPPIESAPIQVLCSVDYSASKMLAMSYFSETQVSSDGPLRMHLLTTEFVTFMNEHYPHHPAQTTRIDFKTVSRGFLAIYMTTLHTAATTETDIVKRSNGAKLWEKLVKIALPGVDCLGDAGTPPQETGKQRHLFDDMTGGLIDGDILFVFVMCCFIIFWYSTWQKKA